MSEFKDKKDPLEVVICYERIVLKKYDEKVHKIIVEALIKKDFCSLENMTVNIESEKEKILTKTDCSYCAYKDICKEQIGEML